MHAALLWYFLVAVGSGTDLPIRYGPFWQPGQCEIVATWVDQGRRTSMAPSENTRFVLVFPGDPPRYCFPLPLKLDELEARR